MAAPVSARARAREANAEASAAPPAIELTVNGERQRFTGPLFRRLIDVLREDLGLTGTKEGCGEGECGACTVLIDGEAVNSCLVPICQVEGRSVRTVESLGRPDALNPLQRAFLDSGGAQCGICTPGMLMTATAWIEQGGSADPEAIRRVLAGNLCRCTGYQHIVNAVVDAVRARKRTSAVVAGRGHARTRVKGEGTTRVSGGRREERSRRRGESGGRRGESSGKPTGRRGTRR